MSPDRTVLQRVVLPLDADPDMLPLYVEIGAASAAPSDADAAEASRVQHPEQVIDRRRLDVPAGQRASFATWLNAFPASYWAAWTRVGEVELEVEVEGDSQVVVYRSTATGTLQRVAVDHTAPDRPVVRFTLPLTAFADGGWYWFDVVAGRDAAVLQSAQWLAVDDVQAEPGSATVAITTFNRPGFVVALLKQLSAAPDTLARLDEVLVVDQGTALVEEEPGFAEVSAALGGRLRVLRQGNLGGSGGFSRGMLETVTAGKSTYALLLDDDVALDPECILRALAFADACRTPTIVGGHMFSLYARSTLHSVGEVVRPWRFWWGAAPFAAVHHDFQRHGLRDSRGLHRRIDVDYNGWWMCLIPVSVIEKVGLSLPLFIKWDDAEYGLRASKAGFRTVSMPGVAVWHVPWTEKDDALDWQAYFHQRNRLVAALLHSPYQRGGRLVRESLSHQAKHLLSMQYSVVALRNKAIEDVLSGPSHLHARLAAQLPEVRALRAQFPDGRAVASRSELPEVVRRRPLRHDLEPRPPHGRKGTLLTMGAAVVRQVLSVPAEVEHVPQDRVPAMDAAWWRLSSVDSALVSSTDGTSVSWYRRDRKAAAALLRETTDLHQKLLLAWPALSAAYREAADDLVSMQSWRSTLGLGDGA